MNSITTTSEKKFRLPNRLEGFGVNEPMAKHLFDLAASEKEPLVKNVIGVRNVGSSNKMCTDFALDIQEQLEDAVSSKLELGKATLRFNCWGDIMRIHTDTRPPPFGTSWCFGASEHSSWQLCADNILMEQYPGDLLIFDGKKPHGRTGVLEAKWRALLISWWRIAE